MVCLICNEEMPVEDYYELRLHLEAKHPETNPFRAPKTRKQELVERGEAKFQEHLI